MNFRNISICDLFQLQHWGSVHRPGTAPVQHRWSDRRGEGIHHQSGGWPFPHGAAGCEYATLTDNAASTVCFPLLCAMFCAGDWSPPADSRQRGGRDNQEKASLRLARLGASPVHNDGEWLQRVSKLGSAVRSLPLQDELSPAFPDISSSFSIYSLGSTVNMWEWWILLRGFPRNQGIRIYRT
jgi:hypothetical protein